MKSFFQKNEKKYLRKKSEFMHDWIMGGCVMCGLGIFFNHFNKKMNPIDPIEDEDDNEVGNNQ